MYLFKDEPIAVSLVNIRYGSLLVLSVVPKHRNHGLGSAIVNLLMPNFIRALVSKVKFFEKLGYKVIGESKNGRALQTQIMVRANLINLGERINKINII